MQFLCSVDRALGAGFQISPASSRGLIYVNFIGWDLVAHSESHRQPHLINYPPPLLSIPQKPPERDLYQHEGKGQSQDPPHGKLQLFEQPVIETLACSSGPESYVPSNMLGSSVSYE
ncbi:hypothetical protein CIHG_01357 [Coccidioides immitis H538.4]|uniref:Uncharacterized protein n=2 Tax=Coccidioides immitis TaxID=5501 RepID=A0A0J8RHT7_COCIT|nr:hypothetical protein CIRG_01205 [Coccidioides immitis RMSCC 2394]KMU83574.1 hypothetical protein CIHG_01357 [Coccidioides immitis H538.4]